MKRRNRAVPKKPFLAGASTGGPFVRERIPGIIGVGAASLLLAVASPVRGDEAWARTAPEPSSAKAAGSEATEAATVAAVAKAETFLALLTPAEADAVMYDFSDDKQRANWSNLPTGSVKRGGLRMGDVTKPMHV